MIIFLARTCMFIIGLMIVEFIDTKWRVGVGVVYFIGWIWMDITKWVLKNKSGSK